MTHDSHRDRATKYLNFESNVDVHFCLTPFPHVRFFLTPPPSGIARVSAARGEF